MNRRYSELRSYGFRLQHLMLSGAMFLCSCAIPYPTDELVASVAEQGDCVIMMHGLARTNSSMKPMRAALLQHGYLVVSLTYPSRNFTIETLSDSTIPGVVQACREQGATRINFVSHSLGGILVRYYLESNEVAEMGRFIMLAPPNQGSEVIDTFSKVPGFIQIFGPAGMQLGTAESDLPKQLGPVKVDTAIIAGTSSINPLLSLSLPNPDDGKVSVASTRVDGMCALLELPIAHPFIMKDARVITEVLTYISTGKFASEGAEYLDCTALKKLHQE